MSDDPHHSGDKAAQVLDARREIQSGRRDCEGGEVK